MMNARANYQQCGKKGDLTGVPKIITAAQAVGSGWNAYVSTRK
jgi:hypothetical protein